MIKINVKYSEYCPVCGKSQFKILGKPRICEELLVFDDIHNINIVKCKDCGFYFAEPKLEMSIKVQKFLYDETYFKPMTFLGGVLRSIERRRRINKLVKISNSPIETFLDIGCGEGLILKEAISRGWTTYGQDVSNNLKIESKEGLSFEFHLGELEGAGYPDNFFDALYMDSVLEHVEYPFEMLKEMFRILKPGGVVHICVPNEDSMFNDFKHMIFKIQNRKISEKISPLRTPYHINGFNPRSIRIILKRCGFIIDDIIQLSEIIDFIRFKPNERAFWIYIFMIPVNLMGIMLKKGMYMDIFAHKFPK